MQRTTILIPRDLREALDAITAETGATFSELLRRAIVAYVQSYRTKTA